jgi:hypothetical protein
MIDNDKNVLLTHKKEITEKDLNEIKDLKDLKESIKIVEQMEKAATGKKRFKLKKWLIEMHQEQYVIKDSYNSTMNLSNTVKSFTKARLNENVIINEQNEPESDCMINLFNPAHICALLCNYSALKEDC